MKTPACLFAAFLLPLTASAQRPPLLSPIGPAPLLYVKLSGQPGMRITFYQGRAPAREFAAPVIVGLRPGYIYRLKVTGFPDRPNFATYPTLEVRGTLRLTPELSALRFPAPVYLGADDIDHLVGGSVLTKVIFLEDPKHAIAEASSKDQPLQVDVPADRDLLDESRHHGRPVLVLRIGNRESDEDELQRVSVPNTILFPGEQGIGRPHRPPQIPSICFNPFDPILGPKVPEECLRDGGDAGLPVGFDATGRLDGLEPEDTAAEYRDSQGRRRIAISNRVCLCVPRYVALRSVTRLELSRQAVVLGSVRRSEAQIIMESQRTPRTDVQVEQLAGAAGKQRTSVVQAEQWATAVGKVEGLHVVTARARTADVTSICREEAAAARPLCLKKWSDRDCAEVGDVITFFLKFSNDGGRPITDVVVSDSLTGRLEYVPGSAQSSRNTVFTTQVNEAGSVVLRWEITGTLLPCEGGILTFKARVR